MWGDYIHICAYVCIYLYVYCVCIYIHFRCFDCCLESNNVPLTVTKLTFSVHCLVYFNKLHFIEMKTVEKRNWLTRKCSLVNIFLC